MSRKKDNEIYEDVPSPEEYMKMMGITSPEHLREVIKSMPKLNISCFVIPLREKMAEERRRK